eukprot:snap_masked-scaffold_11-processed-gene-7.23-mRNA-1 protein AED:1.00 eAED:1.00 QI:0/0/0/0/1/1/3/0/1062
MSTQNHLVQLENILSKFYDPGTTNQEKREIENHLEQFKKDSSAFELCCYVLKNSNDEKCLWFAVSTLKSLCAYPIPPNAQLANPNFIGFIYTIIEQKHAKLKNNIRNMLIGLVSGAGARFLSIENMNQSSQNICLFAEVDSYSKYIDFIIEKIRNFTNISEFEIYVSVSLGLVTIQDLFNNSGITFSKTYGILNQQLLRLQKIFVSRLGDFGAAIVQVLNKSLNVLLSQNTIAKVFELLEYLVKYTEFQTAVSDQLLNILFTYVFNRNNSLITIADRNNSLKILSELVSKPRIPRQVIPFILKIGQACIELMGADKTGFGEEFFVNFSVLFLNLVRYHFRRFVLSDFNLSNSLEKLYEFSFASGIEDLEVTKICLESWDEIVCFFVEVLANEDTEVLHKLNSNQSVVLGLVAIAEKILSDLDKVEDDDDLKKTTYHLLYDIFSISFSDQNFRNFMFFRTCMEKVGGIAHKVRSTTAFNQEELLTLLEVAQKVFPCYISFLSSNRDQFEKEIGEILEFLSFVSVSLLSSQFIASYTKESTAFLLFLNSLPSLFILEMKRESSGFITLFGSLNNFSLNVFSIQGVLMHSECVKEVIDLLQWQLKAAREMRHSPAVGNQTRNRMLQIVERFIGFSSSFTEESIVERLIRIISIHFLEDISFTEKQVSTCMSNEEQVKYEGNLSQLLTAFDKFAVAVVIKSENIPLRSVSSSLGFISSFGKFRNLRFIAKATPQYFISELQIVFSFLSNSLFQENMEEKLDAIDKCFELLGSYYLNIPGGLFQKELTHFTVSLIKKFYQNEELSFKSLIYLSSRFIWFLSLQSRKISKTSANLEDTAQYFFFVSKTLPSLFDRFGSSLGSSQLVQRKKFEDKLINAHDAYIGAVFAILADSDRFFFQRSKTSKVKEFKNKFGNQTEKQIYQSFLEVVMKYFDNVLNLKLLRGVLLDLDRYLKRIEGNGETSVVVIEQTVFKLFSKLVDGSYSLVSDEAYGLLYTIKRKNKEVFDSSSLSFLETLLINHNVKKHHLFAQLEQVNKSLLLLTEQTDEPSFFKHLNIFLADLTIITKTL